MIWDFKIKCINCRVIHTLYMIGILI